MEENTNTQNEVITLTAFEAQMNDLFELVKDYENLIVTADNKEEMNEKRLVLYRKRISIQRDEKANNDILNKAKTLNAEKAKKMISIIAPKEQELERKLKELERIEKEKKEKEIARVNAHKANLDGLQKRVFHLAKLNTIAELEDFNNGFLTWAESYDGEEFQKEFDEAIATVKISIANTEVVLKKKEADEEAERLALLKNEQFDTKEVISENFQTKTDEYRESEEKMPKTGGNALKYPQGGGTGIKHSGDNLKYENPVTPNMIYAGFRFFIDPKIDESLRNEILDSIRQIINKIAF